MCIGNGLIWVTVSVCSLSSLLRFSQGLFTCASLTLRPLNQLLLQVHLLLCIDQLLKQFLWLTPSWVWCVLIFYDCFPIFLSWLSFRKSILQPLSEFLVGADAGISCCCLSLKLSLLINNIIIHDTIKVYVKNLPWQERSFCSMQYLLLLLSLLNQPFCKLICVHPSEALHGLRPNSCVHVGNNNNYYITII